MHEYICCLVITKHNNLEIKFPTGEYGYIYVLGYLVSHYNCYS